MDLTQSFGDTESASTQSQSARNATEDVLITDVTYETEDVGHRIEMPVVRLQTRRGDGTKRELTVEGFRPSFGLQRDDFAQTLNDVCNDRRVLGAVGDFSPEWAQKTLFDGDLDASVTGEDIAAHISSKVDADLYHTDEPFETRYDESVIKVYTRLPNDVSGADGIRNDLDCSTYEADVPFVRKFLIETELYRGARVPVETNHRRGPDRLTYYNWPGSAQNGTQRVDSDVELVQQLEPAEPPEIDARMIIYDIEVATEGEGFPDPSRAAHPITAISAYDNYDDEYRLWGLVSPQWGEQGYTPEQISEDVASELGELDGFPDTEIDSDDPDVASFKLFQNETQLLSDFHQYVVDRDPDIFTGYNADGFDHPYLIRRSYRKQARLIRQYTTGSDPAVWVEEYNGERQTSYQMSGIVTLDILDAYRKTQFRELDSYKLDDVAEAELGYGKTGLAGDELDVAWHESPIDFFVYSIRDTQATVGVERESGLIDLFENLREVTGAMYETAVNNGPMLDTMFLRRAYESGLVLPSNTEPDETVYHGAKVFETKPGRHENCVYPDLSSLYPSLLSMMNLGSETIIGDEDALAASEYTEDDCYEFPVDNREFAVVPKGETIDHVDREQYKGVKTPDGGLREMFDPVYTWEYVLKPDVRESFVTDTVDDLIELKNEYRGALYSAVKRVTNSCFTPDTDVLTPDGVRNIRDLDVGDQVYSLNTKTNELEYKRVTELIEKPDYRGELVEIQNQHTDLKITPDHRLYVRRSRRTNEWEITEAGDLNEYTHYEAPHNFTRGGPGIDEVDISPFVQQADFGSDNPIISDEYITTERARKSIPRYYDGDTFVELLAWYITEGSTTATNTDIHNIVNISKYKEHHQDQRNQIVDTIEECGLDAHNTHSKEIRISNAVLPGVFNEICGNGSENKRIPEFVFQKASLEQKKHLIETLMLGDGDKRESPRRYSTKSTELRDDFMRLCIECGYDPQYTYDDGGENNSGVWRIHFDEDRKNTFRMYRDGDTSNAENGVYCVQVEDNHTLLAGRNGKFTAVFNCYGVLGDSASGGLGFRLYDRKVAEGITLAGRETITHTADQFTQFLRDNYDPDAYLVGGDTDSCVSSMPNAPSLQNAWVWAEEGCQYVDESYDQFARETFGFGPDDDHRLHVELESLASALFYLGGDDTHSYTTNEKGMLVSESGQESVKKRYAQHIVWDDDDGWIDTEDPSDGYDGALEDTEDRSELKYLDSVTYETYTDGPLQGEDPQSHIGIKGFEYVRSDSAQITRDAQLRVLTDILLMDSPRDRIEPFLTDLVEDIRNERVSLRDMARPKGIGKNLDDYGWEDIEDIDDREITDEIELHGGRWRQRPGPTYRGAKYADDHFRWEELGEGTKPMKIPIERIRSDKYPAVYEYESYPQDGRPDSPEVGQEVDAIAVDNPERLPDGFIVDTEEIITKELEEKLEDILRTIDLDWDDLTTEGRQTGLSAFA